MSLATLLDLVHLFDGGDGLRPKLTVILDGNVATFLELEAWIDGELFAGEFSVYFGPLCLARILSALEGFAALFTAESELLKSEESFFVRFCFIYEFDEKKTYFAVVPDEHHTVSWIDFRGTEVTRLDPHDCVILFV